LTFCIWLVDWRQLRAVICWWGHQTWCFLLLWRSRLHVEWRHTGTDGKKVQV